MHVIIETLLRNENSMKGRDNLNVFKHANENRMSFVLFCMLDPSEVCVCLTFIILSKHQNHNKNDYFEPYLRLYSRILITG